MTTNEQIEKINNAKVICMYCGKAYDKFAADTPELMSDHVMTCDRSPLVQAIKEAEELNQGLVIQNVNLESERDQLKAELTEMRKDKERLDWLCGLKNKPAVHCEEFHYWGNNDNRDTLRTAIDSAMKGEV